MKKDYNRKGLITRVTMICCYFKNNLNITNLSKFSKNWMERMRLFRTKSSGFFLSCSRILMRLSACASSRIAK